MKKLIQNIGLAAVLLGVTPLALADNRVWGDDQDVSGGTVTVIKFMQMLMAGWWYIEPIKT